MSFKIGDRVRLARSYHPLALGILGTVCQVDGKTYGGQDLNDKYLGVCFDVPNGAMHDCQGACRNKHGFYIPLMYFELAPLSALERLDASIEAAIALVEAGS